MYQKTFNIGLYQSERIGVEMDLHSGENSSFALDECKKLVNEFHVQNNPHLYSSLEPLKVEVHPQIEPITQVTRPKDQILGMVFDIESVTELTVLKSYDLLCRNNEKLSQAYQKKLKELTNE
jgi:hypothetical protein